MCFLFFEELVLFKLKQTFLTIKIRFGLNMFGSWQLICSDYRRSCFSVILQLFLCLEQRSFKLISFLICVSLEGNPKTCTRKNSKTVRKIDIVLLNVTRWGNYVSSTRKNVTKKFPKKEQQQQNKNTLQWPRGVYVGLAERVCYPDPRGLNI